MKQVVSGGRCQITDWHRMENNAKEAKKSKQRFTIVFLVNAAGDKGTPIVVWNSENPRYFRGFDKNYLPVRYYHQKMHG